MVTPNDLPKFNYEEIPESARQGMLAIIHTAAHDYLRQPGVSEKFAAWLERKYGKEGGQEKWNKYEALS